MANLGKGKKGGGPSRLSLLRQQGADGIGTLPNETSGSIVVDIGLLIEDPENERKTFDERELKNLSDSIHEVGIVEPITVTPIDSGGYMILAGHRRYRAAKMAGLKKVTVVISDPIDTDERRKRSIVSNIQREDIPPLELARAIRALLDSSGMKQRQLAKMIGKNESWVSDRLRILNLSTPAQTRLDNGGITQSSVDALSRISRIEDAKKQLKLVKALEQGASNREIREQIEKILPKKGRGDKADQPKPKGKRTRTIQLDTCTVTVTFKDGKENLEKALQAALDHVSKRSSGK